MTVLPPLEASGELELWGGVECSMVRVGDNLRDEVRETGHYHRIEDLDQVANLGITVLRYPILWEMVAPDGWDNLDWSWHDRRLARLAHLGITPIVGLVHHGIGPRYADLATPFFADGLARFAGLVAERYPWLRHFAPVNEPVTTARFSALYGHWYPHIREQNTFLRFVVAQCVASVGAIEAIRGRIPEAVFVQTEDLGRVFSTPWMADQARYENERRWLSLDLLTGRVDNDHPFREAIRHAGVTDDDIDRLRHSGTRPDLLGINHYLTSDRFLDERLDGFPSHTHGGNGRESYADTEAFRVNLPLEWLGPAPRLREAWARYQLPIAVTEVHNGSIPSEQIGWLHEVWNAALELRSEGADIRAVTAWSLFGAVDWDSLLTRFANSYEAGAFDVRTTPPALTPLGVAIAKLATRESNALQPPNAGWWRETGRVTYPAA